MPNKTLTIDQVLTLLAETAPRIEALTAGLKPGQLRAATTYEEWSANDVLAHLRACADVWGSCMVSIIRGTSTLQAVNPTTWINSTNYREQDFRPSLQSFADQRADLLAVLKPLPPESWSLSATVTGAGSALERNVLFYGRWLAGHERGHVKQVARIARAMRPSSSSCGR